MQAIKDFADFERILSQYPIVRNQDYRGTAHIRPVKHAQISTHVMSSTLATVENAKKYTDMPDADVVEEVDLPGSISLIVRSLKGVLYPIKVLPEDPISVLKKKVAKQTSVPVEHIRLILKGKALPDESKIQDVGLEDQSKVHFTIKPAAKASVATTVAPTTAKPITASAPIHTSRPEVLTDDTFWEQLEEFLKGSKLHVDEFIKKYQSHLRSTKKK
eukprot:CFRG1957T1